MNKVLLESHEGVLYSIPPTLSEISTLSSVALQPVPNPQTLQRFLSPLYVHTLATKPAPVGPGWGSSRSLAGRQVNAWWVFRSSESCYVSTGRQPDLGGALSDCHLLSCAGFLQGGLQPILTRDGTLQHVYSGTATLQPVRSCKQSHWDEQGLAKSASGIASAWDTR